MKKLIFVLLLSCFCNLAKAQSEPGNRIITVDGKEISGSIRTYLNKKLIFWNEVPELNGNMLPVELVSVFQGPCPKDMKKVMLKDNPEIAFKKSKDDGQVYNSQYVYPSSGDLIKKSASLRLGAVGVGVVTSVLVGSKVMKDPNVIVASGIFGLGLYVAGEITQIKAGKLMNSEKFSIEPAGEGIGLSINF